MAGATPTAAADPSGSFSIITCQVGCPCASRFFYPSRAHGRVGIPLSGPNQAMGLSVRLKQLVDLVVFGLKFVRFRVDDAGTVRARRGKMRRALIPAAFVVAAALAFAVVNATAGSSRRSEATRFTSSSTRRAMR